MATIRVLDLLRVRVMEIDRVGRVEMFESAMGAHPLFIKRKNRDNSSIPQQFERAGFSLLVSATTKIQAIIADRQIISNTINKLGFIEPAIRRSQTWAS
jgi:hypothetical protein